MFGGEVADPVAETPNEDVFASEIPQVEDDGLDDEEREHLRTIADEQEERLRSLGEKINEEHSLKQERKDAGSRAVEDWYSKRTAQIESRQKSNKEDEWSFLKLRDDHKESKNPWEKIIDNCEMNS